MHILGAYAKLRKATVSFVMSVRLSVRKEQLDSHWMNFHENRYLSIFRKPFEKIQVSLISDENNGRVAWKAMYVSDRISLNSS
jgi:hypothetical protein